MIFRRIQPGIFLDFSPQKIELLRLIEDIRDPMGMTSMACEEEVNRHEARQKAKRLVWKPRSTRNLLRIAFKVWCFSEVPSMLVSGLFFLLAHLDPFGKFFNTWVPELLITVFLTVLPARIDRRGQCLVHNGTKSCGSSGLTRDVVRKAGGMYIT